jgi:AcrR family transcriptional regulator
MARRSDHTREELRNLAIQTGYELIDLKGFSALSARQIAANMGYTVGTLYNVFGTLELLILHIHAQTLDEWHAHLVQGLKRCKSDPLHFLARGYIAFARKHYNRWTALFEYHTPDNGVPDWYAEKLNRLFELVEAALLPHLENDHVKARHNAKILWASIHGICILSLSGKLDKVGSEKAETLVDSLLETYLRGLQ